MFYNLDCAQSVRTWAHAAIGSVAAATTFSITNFSLNAKIVRAAVVADAFSSNDSYIYRLPAAQIAAASLSFLTCVAFLILYGIFAIFTIPRAKKRLLGGIPPRSA